MLVSETLFPSYFELRTTDEAHKPSDSECDMSLQMVETTTVTSATADQSSLL
jgi:hypothetical protein